VIGRALHIPRRRHGLPHRQFIRESLPEIYEFACFLASIAVLSVSLPKELDEVKSWQRGLDLNSWSHSGWPPAHEAVALPPTVGFRLTTASNSLIIGFLALTGCGVGIFTVDLSELDLLLPLDS
jgi:hypothetical protein